MANPQIASRMPADPWLPLTEAADYAGMHVQTVRKLCRKRELAYSRRGKRGHIKIRVSELDRYMKRNLIRAAREG